MLAMHIDPGTLVAHNGAVYRIIARRSNPEWPMQNAVNLGTGEGASFGPLVDLEVVPTPQHGGPRPNSGPPTGNTNAAKRGVAKLVRIRTDTDEQMKQILALSPRERGRAILGDI